MAFPALAVGKQQLLPLAALLLLVSVTVLTGISLLIQQPAIETDLLQRTRQALAKAGLPTNIVHFSGRDGVLSGTIASDADVAQLQSVVSSVYGVRDVEVRLVPVKTEAAQPMAEVSATLPSTPNDKLYSPSKKYPIEQIDLSVLQFEYARAELDADGISVLHKVIEILRQHPSMVIEVSAHTDNDGTALGNLTVSQARAEEVRNYLLSQGVATQQVVAQGYGSTRPVADRNHIEESAKNRRIDITVLKE
ncbi:OmpA family protein [Thiothrix lacustris]|uniref:OmpA family protein n=1 Tax=Thiothrix lacustris TaxID=525917 RepID=UPI0027E497D1|nr:OmpA family protein [Thiothrix lacustris]WMP15678.1 OmpA family protein [Thiothrix lacustris]